MEEKSVKSCSEAVVLSWEMKQIQGIGSHHLKIHKVKTMNIYCKRKKNQIFLINLYFWGNY